MEEFPLKSVWKICVGGLRGQDAPAKTMLQEKGRKTQWIQFPFHPLH